jgi:hypothetical protein
MFEERDALSVLYNLSVSWFQREGKFNVAVNIIPVPKFKI